MSTHRTICDFLVDLYQNAVESGADTVRVTLDNEGGLFRLTVGDNGCGMDDTTLAKAQDPFWSDGVKHPHRKVGLGLPFVIQTVTMTQGSFRIESSNQPPHGTEVEVGFNRQHWDTPPLGDLAGCLSQLMAWEGNHEVVLNLYGQEATRSELREALGSFEDPEARQLLAQYFTDLETTAMEANAMEAKE
ncbi:MAG: sensor histidine kinase [Spirochaetales bacterium]